MKNRFSSLLLMLTSLLALQGCEVYINDDDYERRGDRDRAYTIAGEWQGDLGMFYAVEDPRTGRVVEFDAANSYIVFYPQYVGATFGSGKQIDFYRYGPYSERYNSFNWEVRNGVLYLDYYEVPGEASLDGAIYDYRLTSSSFVGRFGDSNSTFQLRSLSFARWNSYSTHYNYVTNRSWLWSSLSFAPAALLPAELSDTATSNTAPKITTASLSAPLLRQGRRLTQR